jgi:hypothetical protein
MTAEEIGVNMGLDHALDRQAIGCSLFQVHVHIASRIHDDGPTGRLVAYQVRGVGEASEVVLSEYH